jgi:hypothetical protein
MTLKFTKPDRTPPNNLEPRSPHADDARLSPCDRWGATPLSLQQHEDHSYP